MIPTLSKWFVVQLTHKHFFGYVLGDPNCNPRELIQTDAVVDVNVERKLLFTTGKTYKLGIPDHVWAASQPENE
jgi:hypothetical protein